MFTEPNELKESMFVDGAFESKVGKVTRICKHLMRVRVYRNLNKPEFYSILAMEGENKGKVVGYARSVLIKDCKFKVSEASRQRVHREQRRNVHAFCEGYILDAFESAQSLSGDELVITYNPYKLPTFYKRSDETAQTDNCAQALLQGSDVHIIDSI